MLSAHQRSDVAHAKRPGLFRQVHLEICLTAEDYGRLVTAKVALFPFEFEQGRNLLSRTICPVYLHLRAQVVRRIWAHQETHQPSLLVGGLPEARYKMLFDAQTGVFEAVGSPP